MHKPEPLPVACTLDLSAIGPRLADVQRLTREHLRSHQLEGRALRLSYAATAAPDVQRIVELERVCCAFLDFRLNETADRIVLAITAPEQAGGDAQWLFAQFLPQAAVPSLPPSRSGGCACCRA